ncbi:MAG TPA: HlyD family efflux transporter periplasmic adaptor subunit [Burkholderiales bacterium]
MTVTQPSCGPAVEAVYATGSVEPVDFFKVAPLDRAESELAQVEAQIAAARRALAEAALVARPAGVVLRQDGEPGEMAASGQVLFWVGDPGKLRTTADLDEEDIPQVRPDPKSLLKADAIPTGCWRERSRRSPPGATR